MKKFFSKLKKNRKGYTLTELIVVVAILGILAVIAVPMVMNSVNDAKANADETSIKAIEAAVQLCLADGSLQFIGGILKDSSKLETGISDAVRMKLAGMKYPSHSVDSTKNWKLDLHSIEVSQAEEKLTSDPGKFVILD
ncbi:prepilin-type N-terminal cleavage/methylation domain-containing protein [Ruminiclostridium sufflavum DSM 19573]|uniref:Prepilin-type N-terminal cleavage/methylation domain-containing protein n=1 Tax=Ruminiclostridium sufflavum DSM 19573 TaxID=1121337 RepID=A0A318Y267_9FIRM|nr:prepilin-type N-terminal cleavage/methylation domain-containing protein [Ruminiclostridium sufflavum]PYG85646.1 prepilin-type N-terminal cleavage/methylation domain-containing protein [Ruminiclostridium sufflavum DSM 19573]